MPQIAQRCFNIITLLGLCSFHRSPQLPREQTVTRLAAYSTHKAINCIVYEIPPETPLYISMLILPEKSRLFLIHC